MTVSGLTITSAVRHPVQMRDSRAQSQRSAFASRMRRRLRCSTCSWCRNAKTSSWSAARERAHVRRVSAKDRSTDIMPRSVSIVGRNINGRNKNGLFSNHSRSLDRESFRYQKFVWWLPAATKTGAMIGAQLSLLDALCVCYEAAIEDERARCRSPARTVASARAPAHAGRSRTIRRGQAQPEDWSIC